MQPQDTRRLASSVAALEQELAKGFDPNTKNTVGDTVLHVALRAYPAVAALLLARKDIDVNATSRNGNTPLGDAVTGGKLEFVKALIARGAKLSTKENPLFYIARTQCPAGAYAGAKLIIESSLIDAPRIAVALARAKQEGDKKLVAILDSGASKPSAKRAKTAKARKKTKAPPPLAIDIKKLKTDAQREKALDALGTWFVAALLSAAADRKKASIVIKRAISAFYDIRESAGQERGESAGHFFMVDAVGLGASTRAVPWSVLEKQASESELELWSDLFDELET